MPPNAMSLSFKIVLISLFAIFTLNQCGTETTTGDGADDPSAEITSFPLAVTEGTVVFISDRHSPKGEIYIIGDDGDDEGIVRITNNDTTEVNPSLSPDGTQILYTSDAAGNNDCWRIQLDTGAAENLTADSLADDDWCRYSPDGAMLTFDSDRTGNRDLFMYFLQGRQGPIFGDVINITADNPGYDGQTSCRPDPSDNNVMRIVFTSIRNGSSVKEIYQTTFNDETFEMTAPTRVTDQAAAVFPESDKLEADISPDVQKVVYKVEVSAIKHEIHYVDLNALGAASSNLTDHDLGVRCSLGAHPNFFPDSTKVLFENVGDPVRLDISRAVNESSVFLVTRWNDADPFVFKLEPF